MDQGVTLAPSESYRRERKLQRVCLLILSTPWVRVVHDDPRSSAHPHARYASTVCFGRVVPPFHRLCKIRLPDNPSRRSHTAHLFAHSDSSRPRLLAAIVPFACALRHRHHLAVSSEKGNLVYVVLTRPCGLYQLLPRLTFNHHPVLLCPAKSASHRSDWVISIPYHDCAIISTAP